MDEKIEVVASGAIKELRELKTEVEANIKSFLELNNLSRNIEFKLKGGAASISDLNTLVDNAVKNINQMRVATDGVTQAQQKETKTTKEVVELLRELNKLRKDVEKQQKAEEKQVKQLTSDYDILNKAYSDQIKRVRDLFFSVGELNPAYIEAQQEAMRMGDTLKRVDAAVGIHNRNVGNYNSALTNLNQIWRELPNAAFGLQTVIASLSNNLGPAIESLSQVVEQNKALAAQGKPTQSALSLVADSLFSVAGMASLLAAGFTILTPIVISTFEEIAAGGETAEQAAERISKLDKEIKRLKQDVQDLFDNQGSFYESTIEAIDKTVEADQRRIDLMKAQNKDADDILNAEISLNRRRIQENNNMIKSYYDRTTSAIRFDREVAELRQKNADLQNDIDIKQAQRQQQLLEEDKKRAEERKKLREEEYKQTIELTNKLRETAEKMSEEIRNSYKKMFPTSQKDTNSKDVMSFLSQDTLNYERMMFNELTDLNKQYQDGNITNQEVFEKKRTDIIRKWTIERLRIELKAAEESAKNLTGDDRVKALNQVASINKQISDLEVEQTKTANENKIRNLNDFLTRYKEVLSEIANFSAQIGRSITENELGEIQKRKAQLDQDFAKRKEYLAATSATEIEYQKKLAGAEAQRATELEKLRQEEIKAKQKQAIYDKIAAIAQAGINTALAITAFLAKGNLTGAAAAGVLGAVQVATIAATPLPQYAKGTDDHPGGAFIAAEGNKPEILQNPDGTMQVLSKEGIYTAPAHARVIPQNEWATKLPFLSDRLIKSMQHQQQIKTDKMESYLASIDYKIGRINRPTTQKKGILLPSQRKSMN